MEMEKKRRTSLSGGARWLPASVTLVEGESGVLESGVSYATDLLHSLSAVRSKTATSQKVADEFLTFLGARARAEEAYAKSLRKLAGGFAPPTTPDSTLNEAMEALRGDLLNKAVQHEVLAKGGALPGGEEPRCRAHGHLDAGKDGGGA